MNRLILALAALALAPSLPAVAAPKPAPVSCESVPMPEAVAAWVGECETDDECETAELVARRAYCRTHRTAAYCTCRW